VSAAESINRVVVLDPEYASAAAEIASRFPNFDVQYGLEAILHNGTANSFQAIVTKTAVLTDELIDLFEQTRIVVKLGQNWTNVSTERLRTRGVEFVVVPRKGPTCVAELALSLILALSKDLVVSHKSVAEGAYYLRGLRPVLTSQSVMAFHWMGNQRVHEVRRRTLGIVGMGEIGLEVALRARSMGMEIIYTKRRRLPQPLEEEMSASFRTLNDLLRESDYVCLAVPHTAETEGMIGASELSLMKESAYLINVCRGAIVDEAALVVALQEERIAGAALDVFTHEPLRGDSALCGMNNVILTPHIGGGTGTSPALELGDALEAVEEGLTRKDSSDNMSKPQS
jgi:phosphoglycerate dehydrogenase-like enzyme